MLQVQVKLNTEDLTHSSKVTANCSQSDTVFKRISGAGFLRLSGIGTGSLGRLLSFRVIIGFTSIESMYERNNKK